jgi:hypothetical protein
MSNTEAALRAEASGDSTAEFEFRGEKFTVPLEYADYPVSYIEAASEGAGVAIQARELLGPEQWARIRAMGLTGRGLDELEAAIKSTNGIDSGNSPASSD